MTVSNPQILKEYELVKRAQENIHCFSELYNKFHYSIFSYVYKKIKNKDVAADITSLVFEKAMRNLNSYAFKGVPFAAWLYRIAFNEVVMYFRKSDKKYLIDANANDLTFLGNEVVDFEKEEKIKCLLASINKQSEEDQKLIQLRFFEELSFFKIAEIIGTTENNAKVKVFRIIAKIRNELNANRIKK
ncbi:MAG: sigma-70 family RNA polymerase sigma factor [Bacteroidetes bacterium]|nr:sigma-70 family RNA polymerase sigma factor [Bacteroidota bacterium]